MALARPAILSYDPTNPPIALLAAADICIGSGQPITPKPVQSFGPIPSLQFPTSEQITGIQLISRYLARLASGGDGNRSSVTPSNSREVISGSANVLYGSSAIEATQIDFFIDMSHVLIEKDTLQDYATHLNQHLQYRTFLVGQYVTIADLLVWQQLTFNPRWSHFHKDLFDHYVDLARWYQHIQTLPIYTTWVGQWQKLQQEKAHALKEHSKAGNYNKVDLKGAVKQDAGANGAANGSAGGKVVTRFPPEPSGYLHIGHAKAALLNAFYAREYNGEMILRFDDTNPSKEKDEYVENITKDLETLGIKHDRLTWTSQYFDLILDYGKQMIKEGKAYVDDTPVEKMREERMKGVESAGRNQSVEQNLKLFDEMIAGSSTGLQCCVRAKIDMNAVNKCMRDPTIFRCKVDVPHHRTGTKYKVYPTYDFCCPIVDAIEDVSHALRTIEYRDRNEQYQWFLKALNLRHVEVLEYARINFAYTLMSKRKLQWFVDTKRVEGWTDPRFPTVQGIIRRGMTVEAINEFMKSQGFSKNINVMEWDKIWTMNKKIIDPTAHRFTAIATDDKRKMVPVNITSTTASPSDLPTELENITVQLHPKHPEIGSKSVGRSNVIYIEQEDAVTVADKEEITLMSWGNAIVEKVQKDSNGVVTSVDVKLNLAGDVKKTEKKIHWLASDKKGDADYVHLKLVEFDHLITVVKIEEDQTVEDVINPNSRVETTAVGEPALRETGVKPGQIIQLNRKGFYYVDKVGSGKSASDAYVLHAVPDGRLKPGTLEYQHAQEQKAQASAEDGRPKKDKKK